MNVESPVVVITDPAGAAANIANVKPANTPAGAADAALVVALSPNSPLPGNLDDNITVGSVSAADTATTTMSGYMGQAQYAGTPTANSCATATLPSEALVHFEITGTFTGTLQVEFLVNSLWVKQNCKISGSPAFATTFNAPVVALAMVSGKTAIRFRAIAWTSGTATITARASVNSGITYVSNAIQLVDGNANFMAAAAGTSNPTAFSVQGISGGVPQQVTDYLTGGQILSDVVGANAVTTFSFSLPQALIWVLSQGGTSRADPFGGTPSASAGIPCLDGAAQPITVGTMSVKVYVPTGATVSCWGFRYG